MTVTMPERPFSKCHWCGDPLNNDDDNFHYGEWCGVGHASCHQLRCVVCA